MPVIYGGHFEYKTRNSQMVELEEINILSRPLKCISQWSIV